jgi:hypothetical protein
MHHISFFLIYEIHIDANIRLFTDDKSLSLITVDTHEIVTKFMNSD